jgi:hypothetical protein
MLDFVVRDMTEDDRRFVSHAYLTTHYLSKPIKFVPKTRYFQMSAKVLEKLLSRAKTVVACFPEDPNELAGFLIYELHAAAMVIHFIYVKKLLRNQGVAKRMVLDLSEGKQLLVASHICDKFLTWRKRVGSSSKETMRLIYDPYVLDEPA